MASEAELGPGSGLSRRGSSRPTDEIEARRSNFIQESIAELRKVEWPGQSQVMQGTVVVLVACLIVGVYLWLNDKIWAEFVQKVLLR